MQISIKTLLISVFAVLIITTSLIGYIIFLNKEIEKKETQISLEIQNKKSWQDKYKMAKDSIQMYAISVEDLQLANKQKDKTISLLTSQVTVYGDSIKILNKSIKNFTEDSTKIVIPFSGYEKRVTYNGNTTYYKKTKFATYSIDIKVDPFIISSEIFWDKADSIIKAKIYADGLLLDNADTKISPELYELIRKKELICPEVPYNGFFDKLAIYASVDVDLLPQNGVFGYITTVPKLGISYTEHNWRISAGKYLTNSNYNVSFLISYSVFDIYNKIFK